MNYKELVHDFLRCATSTYLGAFLFIILGLVFILYLLKWDSYRNEKTKDSFYLIGWMSAVGFILVGILAIILQLLGKI
jgi:hypothetical protein